MKGRFVLCLMGLGASLVGSAIQAQALASNPSNSPLRDPTIAPAVMRAAEAPDGAASSPNAASGVRHLMVLNGRSYLITGGRRLGVGDLLGEARIERFSDSAVWLKEGGITRRVSLYPGIEKTALQERDSTAAPARPGRQKASKKSPPSVAAPVSAASAAHKNTEQEKP